MMRNRTADRALVVYGANPVLELLRSGHPVGDLYLAPGPRMHELAAAARARDVSFIEERDRGSLGHRAGSPHHQGAVAIVPGFRYAPLDRLCRPECRSALLLDGLQDPRNLGAIIRTARAAGLAGVVVPQDRSVAVTGVVAATSAGPLFGVPLVGVPKLGRALTEPQEARYLLRRLARDA